MKFDSLATSKGIIRDFPYLRGIAKNYLGKGKPYDRLLQYLIDADFYKDEDSRYPSVKELSSTLQIPYDKLRIQLNQIYSDLIHHYNSGLAFSLKRTTYEFVLKAYEKYIRINFDNIPFVPRVGEEIIMPYFRHFTLFQLFYVEKIRYEFRENDELAVIVLLNVDP